MARIGGELASLGEKIRPLRMGGELFEHIVGDERVAELWKIVEAIEFFGNDPKLVDQDRWETIGSAFARYTKAEAMKNGDWKVNEVDPRWFEGMSYQRGYRDDPRLESMYVLRIDERVVRVSEQLGAKDRRYQKEPNLLNEMQYIALQDDVVVDVRTGKVVIDIAGLRDRLPPIEVSYNDIETYMILMSRYILNLIRGSSYINKTWCKDSWVPDLSRDEINNFLLVGSTIPNEIMKDNINPEVIQEFRNRMMASFLINPKLFVNLSVIFNIDSIFPFFETFARTQNYYIYQDVSMPINTEDMEKIVKIIIGKDYIDDKSFLGNVAHIFGIGRWDWIDSQLY